MIAHVVKANTAPEKGTGWHRREADRDCVHQRSGIVRCLVEYSPDMEYLEVIRPADLKSIDMPAPTPRA